jgi:membrane-associated phospholipid phosphatase
MMPGVKLRTIVWAGGLAAGAAAVGHAAMRTPEGPAVDRELFEALNRGHGEEADRFFKGVTELGSMYAAGSAAGALAVLGERRAALSAVAAAGTTWALGQGVKKLVDRPRPYDAGAEATRRMIAKPHGTSWPSSHPAVLTTFTRVAARELGLGGMSRAALSALDLSVAASRVYLGVHYPSDVASGLLMGRAVARIWPRWGRA